MNARPISITEFAARESRRSVLQATSVLFAILAVAALGLSLVAYYDRMDYVARAVESTAASSLTLGDTFQLQRTAESLSRSSGIRSVSIYDSRSGKRIAHAGVLDDDGTSDSPGWPKSELKIIGNALRLRHPITPSGDTIGIIEITCALPLSYLALLLGGMFAVFAIASTFLITRSKKAALAVARPTEVFTREISLAASSGKLRGLTENELRFAEFLNVHSAVQSLLEGLEASQARERQAIEEAVVGRIASKVRHDVKQALLASAAVSKRLTGKPEDLSLMKASLQRIESTIGEIPKIKATGGVQHPVAKSVVRSHFLGALIEPVCGEFQAIIADSKKNVELILEVPGEPIELFVEVDATRFRRMLANLLANALDASRAGGKIGVYVTKENDVTISLEVRDNGAGIPMSILEKVGIPGFTGKVGGSGLGLSSAKEYVESWNGTLAVASVEGQGTSIRILLPRANPSQLSLSSIILPVKGHVVVLDDDPTIHEIWRSRLLPDALAEHGITVSWLFDGKEAEPLVERLKKDGQDFLILADFNLGEGKQTGLEVVRQLGVCDRTVILSNNAEEETLIRECATSAIPLVSKALQAHIPILAS